MTEHCTHEDAGLMLSDDAPYMLRERVETYFHIFAKPVMVDEIKSTLFGTVPCLQCGELQAGPTGRFISDGKGGVGKCGKCGYPGVDLHFIYYTDEALELSKTEYVEPAIGYGPCPLQIHPEMLEE